MERLFQRLAHHGIRLGLASACLAGTVSAYDLEVVTDHGSVHYSQSDILALDPSSLDTETPWTDGSLHFEGASLAAVLADAGVDADQLLAKALNDYTVVIPVQTAIDEGAFVAVRIDGDWMRVRDKGPFWIVFPWSDRPDLLDRDVRSWSIWQLQHLGPVE
ncbi:molybdopterin-dependent oxidoreductase [Saccharospirillum mangrovi]|uniref:molybdopterin-dependent oxidoreductase n=1 Tax=Saccharospirillum mangrovi TaxID=2161747 RepID=UPI0013008702|nr:molybdopterin-dependent oxidoreductase [Saccharospirillum mangrovi]